MPELHTKKVSYYPLILISSITGIAWLCADWQRGGGDWGGTVRFLAVASSIILFIELLIVAFARSQRGYNIFSRFIEGEYKLVAIFYGVDFLSLA
jgi:hypothetical protein